MGEVALHPEYVHRGPFRVVPSFDPLCAALLDDDGNTIFVATLGTARMIETACAAYPPLLAEADLFRKTLLKIREDLRRHPQPRPQAISDALCQIDYALADDVDAMEIQPTW